MCQHHLNLAFLTFACHSFLSIAITFYPEENDIAIWPMLPLEYLKERVGWMWVYSWLELLDLDSVINTWSSIA